MNHDVPYFLVDTNVWLSHYLADRPGHADSRAFVEAALERGCQLLYGVATIHDVFYLACRHIKRAVREEKGVLSTADALAAQKLAWGCIDNMRELATAVGCNEGDVWLASKWRTSNGDLEDNLVRAAAERAKADLLVTWDNGLLAKAFVPTVTPVDALAEIEAWAL